MGLHAKARELLKKEHLDAAPAGDTVARAAPPDVVVVDLTEHTKFVMGGTLPANMYDWLARACYVVAARVRHTRDKEPGRPVAVLVLMDCSAKVLRCKGNEVLKRRASAQGAKKRKQAGAAAAAAPAQPLRPADLGGAPDGSDDVTGREHPLPWHRCGQVSTSAAAAQMSACLSKRLRRAWTALLIADGRTLLRLRPGDSLIVAGDHGEAVPPDAVFRTAFRRPAPPADAGADADAAAPAPAPGWETAPIGGVRDAAACDGEADVLFATVLKHMEANRAAYDLPPRPGPLAVTITSCDTDWIAISALWLATRMVDTPAPVYRALSVAWCGARGGLWWVDVRALHERWARQASEELASDEPLALLGHTVNRVAGLVWMGCDFTRPVPIRGNYGRFSAADFVDRVTQNGPIALELLPPSTPGGRATLRLALRDDVACIALKGATGKVVHTSEQRRAGAYAVMYWLASCLGSQALRQVAPAGDGDTACALYRRAGFTPLHAGSAAALWTWASPAAVLPLPELAVSMPLG
jgi:hypothetical protein